MTIISDTSITPITTADAIHADKANEAHDELQVMVDALNTAMSLEHSDIGEHAAGSLATSAEDGYMSSEHFNLVDQALDGIDDTVTAVNLNTLTEGPSADADALHTHPALSIGSTEAYDGTAATATVLSSETDILSIDLGTVNAGERWIVTQVNNDTGIAGVWTKGATGGLTHAFVKKSSGTATIDFAGGVQTELMQSETLVANAIWSTQLTGVLRVLTSGTLVLKYSGTSIGSNSTLWPFAIFLYAIKIKEA